MSGLFHLLLKCVLQKGGVDNLRSSILTGTSEKIAVHT